MVENVKRSGPEVFRHWDRTLGAARLNILGHSALKVSYQIERKFTPSEKLDKKVELTKKAIENLFVGPAEENQMLKDELNKQKEFFSGMLVNLNKPVDVVLGSGNGVSAPGNIINGLLAKKYDEFTKEDLDKVRVQMGLIASLTSRTYINIVDHLNEWKKAEAEEPAFAHPISDPMPINKKRNINVASAFRYWRSRNLGAARLKIFEFSVLGTMLKFANLFNPLTVQKNRIEKMIDSFNKRSEKLLEGRYRYVLENKKLLEEYQTKAKLFNLMVHDLKTPFNGIMGMCEIMNTNIGRIRTKEEYMYEEESKYKEKYKAGEGNYKDLGSQFEAVEHAAMSSRPLLKHLNSLNEATSGECGSTKLNLFDTVGFVLDRAMPGAEKKKVVLTNLVPRDLCITGDPGLIGSVLGNFVSNGIKYTKEGEVKIFANRIDGHVLISVKDTGMGMSPEKIATLFDMNNTRDNRGYGTDGELGNGIGLRVSKALIEVNDGTIKVTSKPEEGSTFTIIMPVK